MVHYGGGAAPVAIRRALRKPVMRLERGRAAEFHADPAFGVAQAQLF